MKNYLNQVVQLVILVIGGLILLYWLPPMQLMGIQLRPVDILSDIRVSTPEDTPSDLLASTKTWQPDTALPEEEEKEAKEEDKTTDPPVVHEPSAPTYISERLREHLATCTPPQGVTPIVDYADSLERGMKPFYNALQKLAQKRRPVRIAYYGDSFIQGDILTADLRMFLQEEYGGAGVGFMDIANAFPRFRRSVIHSFNGWKSHMFSDTIDFYRDAQSLNGRYFCPDSLAYIQLKGQKKRYAHLDSCQRSQIFFQNNRPFHLTASVNGHILKDFSIEPNKQMQSRTIVSPMQRVRWTVHAEAQNDSLPSLRFYGVTMEDTTGIILDNLAMQGSAGVHLATLPYATMKRFDQERPYDLIVLQYGLNVATRNVTNYTYYVHMMSRIIRRLKKQYPEAGFLLVGIGDREYKDGNGDMHTMPGVLSLMEYQKEIAQENHIAFWDMYQAMGGEGSIVEMVNHKPALANQDYTHINFLGGKRIARLLFNSLEYGKKHYDQITQDM